jgi:hypothetical protein
MSMRQNRDAGKNYFANRITSASTGDLSWYEPHDQDVSELTVTSRGEKKTYVIENLDLEDPQRRPSLDQLAELIVEEFS